MGFANWLADRTGIHPTQIAHVVGNALDNPWAKGALAAGLGFTGVGAPLGAMIMGGAGALGGALHEGGGLRDAFTGGAQGAAIGGAAGGAGAALRNAFAPSSMGAGYGAAVTPGASAASVAGDVGASAPSAGWGGSIFSNAAAAGRQLATTPSGPTGGGFWNGVGSAAHGVGQFVEHHANATGMGLHGLAKMATSNSTNAMNDAERERILQENSTSAYDLDQRKRRDASLEPLRRLLAGQMNGFMQNNHGIAANPYATNSQTFAPNPYGLG